MTRYSLYKTLLELLMERILTDKGNLLSYATGTDKQTYDLEENGRWTQKLLPSMRISEKIHNTLQGDVYFLFLTHVLFYWRRFTSTNVVYSVSHTLQESTRGNLSK